MDIVKSIKDILENKIAYNRTSVIELAKKVGVTMQYLFDVINSDKVPGEELLMKIAHFLHMNAYETDELLKVAALQKTPQIIIVDYLKKSVILEIIKKGMFEIPDLKSENKESIHSVKINISKFICMFSEDELKIRLDKIRDNHLILDIINEVMPYIADSKSDGRPVEKVISDTVHEEAKLDIVPKINIYSKVDVIDGREIFRDIVDTVIIPHMEIKDDVIGLKCRDHSMQPVIDLGDSVIFRLGKKPEDGDIAVCIYCGEMVFRYVRRYENALFLMAANTSVPPILLNGKSDVKILGKVIKVMRDM